MGRLRYIGSKARVARAILDIVGPPSGGHFWDVFSGTGVISREAADRGWTVRANDHLVSSAAITFAQLASIQDVAFAQLGGYDQALAALNAASPIEGFIFNEYSPNGRSRSGHIRKYFSPENAARIDGIRVEIERLLRAEAISEAEYQVLLADLLEGANRVANIAGTYGCFLSQLVPAASRSLVLQPREFRCLKRDFAVTCSDAFDLTCRAEDVVYLDPPYTKRQYAAYYHVLETIAIGDKPEVGGVTGLRSWHAKSSPFCFRRKALASLARLCEELSANTVFISYSSEGHIELEELQTELGRTGTVSAISLGEIGRYRPNQKAGQRESVTEYLLAYRPRVRTTGNLVGARI